MGKCRSVQNTLKNASCKKMVLSDFHATTTLIINHLDNKANQRIHNQTINDLRMGGRNFTFPYYIFSNV